jgi:hypothetical protein
VNNLFEQSEALVTKLKCDRTRFSYRLHICIRSGTSGFVFSAIRHSIYSDGSIFRYEVLN